MAITTRGAKPPAADAPLFGRTSTNIAEPTTELKDSGYPLQGRPGSANYNWLLNYVSAGILHEFIYGIASFDVNETYTTESYTNRVGILYKSLQGANSGNVPESSPSYWHDLRTPFTQTVTATGTLTINSYFDMHVISDTSIGINTITLGSPAFEGQKVVIKSEGADLTYIKGPGVYVDSLALGLPCNLDVTFKAIDGEWVADSGVCAEYESGQDYIRISSQGKLHIINITDTSFSSSPVRAANVTWSIPFANTSYKIMGHITDSTDLSRPYTLSQFPVASRTTTTALSYAITTASSTATVERTVELYGDL